MGDGVGVGYGNAWLHEAKARYSVLIEDADFAIEHDLFRGDLMADDAQFRILPFTRMSSAGNNAHGLVIDITNGANTVPFHFEKPFVALGRSLCEKGFHGDYGGGHGGAYGSGERGRVDGAVGGSYLLACSFFFA
jgi:hypothetical protein